jgi:hypothetical protein
MFRLKGVVKGLAVGAMVVMVVFPGGQAAAATNAPRGLTGVSQPSLTSSAPAGAAAAAAFLCPISSTVERIEVILPGFPPSYVIKATATSFCPEPVNRITAQVTLFEVRNGGNAVAGIGNLAVEKGFQATSTVTATCPPTDLGEVRTFIAMGEHTFAKRGYTFTPNPNTSNSGAYTYSC